MDLNMLQCVLLTQDVGMFKGGPRNCAVRIGLCPESLQRTLQGCAHMLIHRRDDSGSAFRYQWLVSGVEESPDPMLGVLAHALAWKATLRARSKARVAQPGPAAL